ncbi:MAG: hypothetical protein HKP09_07585, partial [Enterobacterales bacterium]|nr:hypothetical protein [Enterobacterales bacterium]
MTTRFFIQLDDHAELKRWFLLRDDNLVQQGSQLNSEARELLDGATVIALLPDSEMVSRFISIPGRNVKQRLKAAPFALEENLASDLEDLHFAFVPKAGSDLIQCLVIDKARFDFYLAALEEMAMTCDAITCTAALLEAPEDAMAVLQLEEDWFVVNDASTQWSANKQNAEVQLRLLSNQEQLEQLLFWGEQASAAWLNAMPLVVHDQIVQSAWHSLLCRYNPATINLLVGDYSNEESVFESIGKWRRTLQFAAALVIAQFIFLSVQWFYLDSQKESLKAEITKLYQEVAPGARVVDPRRQMQQLIKQRQGGGLSESSFLLMLQGLVTAMDKYKGIQPTNLNYSQQNNELRVDLLAGG